MTTARLTAVCAAAARALAGLYHKLVVTRSALHAAPEPRGEQLAVLDKEVFQELHDSLGNRPEAIRSIYTKFIDNTGAHLAELRAQASFGNTRTLHTLKGSAAMVGATRIVDMATRLHDAAPDLRGAAREAALAELERELAEFRRVFEAEIR
jgi:HPt (histidine-containing phosphotransfer) domain-containing protein